MNVCDNDTEFLVVYCFIISATLNRALISVSVTDGEEWFFFVCVKCLVSESNKEKRKERDERQEKIIFFLVEGTNLMNAAHLQRILIVVVFCDTVWKRLV